MSNRFTVAVALATYNGEYYIKEQLLSIKNQTYSVDEVVICDDASCDNTVKIVKDFIYENALNWKLVINDKNVGYKLNFKNCLSQISSDLVFLCDQDDIWLPEKVEEILEIFLKNPSCLGVNSAYTCIDANGENIDKKSLKKSFKLTDKDKKISFEQVIKQNTTPGCTSCYKKSVVEEYLQVTDSSLPHDWELNILAAKSDGLYYVDKALTKYRLHGSNAIGLEMNGNFSVKLKGSEEKRKEILKIQEKRAEYLKKSKENNLANRFSTFLENRKSAIYDKKVLPAVKNLLKVCGLRSIESVSFKSAIGDIVFALKGKGK